MVRAAKAGQHPQSDWWQAAVSLLNEHHGTRRIDGMGRDGYTDVRRKQQPNAWRCKPCGLWIWPKKPNCIECNRPKPKKALLYCNSDECKERQQQVGGQNGDRRQQGGGASGRSNGSGSGGGGGNSGNNAWSPDGDKARRIRALERRAQNSERRWISPARPPSSSTLKRPPFRA